MSEEQAEQIRKLVDQDGWSAVRAHPVLSKVWSKALKEQKDFEDSLEDG